MFCFADLPKFSEGLYKSVAMDGLVHVLFGFPKAFDKPVVKESMGTEVL